MKPISISIVALLVLGAFSTQLSACQVAPEDFKPAKQPLEKGQQDKGRGLIAESHVLPADWKEVSAVINAAAKRGSFTWFGLSVKQALNDTKAAGTPMRIVERNGIALPMTRDFKKGRVNLRVYAGIVIGASIEGEQMVEGAPVSLLAYLGLSNEQANALAKQQQVKMRCIARDGERFPVTADYVLDRVNIRIVKGKVVAAGNG